MNMPAQRSVGSPVTDVIYTDKTLTCLDCQSDFIWTAGEQRFFAVKRFFHAPKRCKLCRGKRKHENAG